MTLDGELVPKRKTSLDVIKQAKYSYTGNFQHIVSNNFIATFPSLAVFFFDLLNG